MRTPHTSFPDKRLRATPIVGMQCDGVHMRLAAECFDETAPDRAAKNN